MMTQQRERLVLWNMGFHPRKMPSDDVQRSRLDVLERMVGEISPSIVALQEAPPVDCLQSVLGLDYEVIEGPMRIVTLFLKERWQIYEPMERARGRALVVKIESVLPQLRFRVWNVHMPFLWRPLHERRAYLRHLRGDLDALRQIDKDSLDLMVGDFNLPPYDKAMVREDGLYANRVQLGASAKKRVDLESVVCRLFNPSWVIFGRVQPPYGSFYKASASHGPWLVPDQAIMSAELAIPGEPQVSIIDRIGGLDLCARSSVRAPKKRVGSDHLPLRVDFRAA